MRLLSHKQRMSQDAQSTTRPIFTTVAHPLTLFPSEWNPQTFASLDAQIEPYISSEFGWGAITRFVPLSSFLVPFCIFHSLSLPSNI